MAIQPWEMAGGAGATAGAGIGAALAPWQNPANRARSYYDQMPGEIEKWMSPYVNAGNRQLPNLENQYGALTNDPGARMNQIGQGFHQSPGFQFALDQALRGAGHAAAAGGMAGSPQHEWQNMDIATQMGNQDYNHWLGNALDMYKTGLGGQKSLYDTGAQVGVGMGEDLASIMAQRAKMEYEAQNAENQHAGGTWGSIFGGAGELAALAAFL